MAKRTPPNRPSFETACAQYVHRFTMEHVPNWARIPRPDGSFYAPHFATDREWYAHTLFWGESPLADAHHCHTSGQTWPLGKALNTPFAKG